jgi:cytochrome oxidase Cu insertion factor (SCO1/SenC/PrrC family)
MATTSTPSPVENPNPPPDAAAPATQAGGLGWRVRWMLVLGNAVVLALGLAALTKLTGGVGRDASTTDGVVPGDSDPPVFSTLPDFRLTTAGNKPFGRADMAGKVWVADVFFTCCQDTCPHLSGAMAELREDLNRRAAQNPDYADVRFLSITVDPARDGAETLRGYADRYGAGPDWVFLTGPKDEIRRVAFEGLKVSSTENRELHSSKLMLIDRAERLRGWYSVVKPLRAGEPDVSAAESARLRSDLRKVLAERP